MTTHHPSAYPPPGIHPGPIDTPMHLAAAYDEGVQHQAVGPGAGPTPYGAYGPVDAYTAAGYDAAGYTQTQPYASSTFLGLNFRDQQLWKGAILGAAVTLLLTSESMQKGIIKGVAKLYAAVQGGVQEIKEKFEDVHAEIRQESVKK